MKEFFFILIAALVGSLLGALFGYGLASYAPEVVQGLAFGVAKPENVQQHLEQIIRIGTALGAIIGLFMGAASMASGLFISALRSRWDDR